MQLSTTLCPPSSTRILSQFTTDESLENKNAENNAVKCIIQMQLSTTLCPLSSTRIFSQFTTVESLKNHQTMLLITLPWTGTVCNF
jgi:hypothetical protein